MKIFILTSVISFDTFFSNFRECVRSCPSNYYKNEDLCLDCHETCKTCSGPTSSECVSCPVDKFFTEKHHICVDQCLAGYHNVNRNCLRCPKNCVYCKEDRCTKCVTDAELIGTRCVAKPGTKPHILIPDSMQGIVLALVILCVFLLCFVLTIVFFMYARNKNLFCWSYSYDKLPCSDDGVIAVNKQDYYDEDDISA